VTVPAIPPIGERLREARVERGLTVRGLARAVDVSASLISQIETGKSSPSVGTLYAITAALEISLEDVFGDPEGTRSPRRRSAATAPSTMAGPAPATSPPAATVVTPPAVVTPAGSRSQNGAPFAADVHGDSTGDRSATAQGLRMLAQKRRVGPVVPAGERELLTLDSGVTWELLGQLPDAHVEFLRITYAPGGSSSGAGGLMRHSGTEYGHVLAGQLTLTLGFDTYVLNPGDSVSFDCSTPHGYANHGDQPAVGVWFVAERTH
jgi:transcriptional regulator with XRE-family HTH domain/quercetin dioxygenase-like cupin family protein